MPLWYVSLLGVTAETVQGNQVHLDWTGTFGGLWEWWPDSWISSRLSCSECLLLKINQNAGNPFETEQGSNPHRADEGTTGLLLSCGVAPGVPLEWRRICLGTS